MGRRVHWRALASATVALAAVSMGLPPRTAWACDSATCSLLTRGGNGLLPRKSFKVDLTFGYTHQGTLMNGGQEVDTVFRPRVFVERERLIPDFHQDIDGSDRGVQLDLTYGLGSRVNLTASLPLSVRHVHDVSHGSPLVEEFGTTGFGDVLLGVRFAVGPRGLVAGVSVKAPTGRNTIDGEFGGGIQDPALQPGTGAFDLVGSLRYAWRTKMARLAWTAAASYQRTTPNGFDYRFGDQAIGILGASREVVPKLSLSLQLKVYHQDASRYLGETVPSTGGTFVYVNPGVMVSPRPALSVFSYVLFVPYRYVSGPQLAPSLSLLFGLSKTFH
jgi:hypothetical protein